MRAPARHAGFTLVELLVALAIMGIVMLGAFVVLSALQRNHTQHQRAVETQADARLLTDMLVSDVRMAGFLVPRFAAVASRDGGAAAPDALCASDPSVMAEAQIVAATGFFDRAILAAPLAASASQVQLDAASMDLDADTNDDFAVGRGIIIADSAGSHCARITGIAGGTIDFDPPTPPGFSVAAGTGRATPARVYEIAGTTLTRDGLPLSDQVENLQVEFFVDSDGDDVMDAGEFPIHDLDGFDVSAVRSVRISVITRTAVADATHPGAGMPAAGNHAGGPPDGFTRRRYVTNAVPRNLLE